MIKEDFYDENEGMQEDAAVMEEEKRWGSEEEQTLFKEVAEPADDNKDSAENDEAHSEAVRDIDGEIPADSYYLFSRLPVRSNATTEELIEIMDTYRTGETEEIRNDAATRMCGILHSYIISLLRQNFSTYMARHRDDLIASAYLGVMKGMVKYDPRKGRATTWFKNFINHECEAYINEQVSHSSAHYASATKKVSAWYAEKEADGSLEKMKDDDEILRNIYIDTGIPVKTIKAVREIGKVKMSPISQEEGDMDIPTEFGNPVNVSEKNETDSGLYDCIKNVLSEKEQIVICYTYGLGGLEELSGREIENRFGIKANQVSTIKKNATHKLKKYMTKVEKDKMKEGSIPLGQLLFGNRADEFIEKIGKSMWV